MLLYYERNLLLNNRPIILSHYNEGCGEKPRCHGNEATHTFVNREKIIRSTDFEEC